MINGAHAILYSHDADATRATLAKVLGTQSVDAGGGWLIFALPPAELAIHPAEGAAELSCTCCATTSPPPWPPCRPRGSRLPGRSATRAGACSPPSPSPAGSSSASTNRATHRNPAQLSPAVSHELWRASVSEGWWQEQSPERLPSPLPVQRDLGKRWSAQR